VGRPQMTVTKRQREQKKRERQQAKIERRALRKNAPETDDILAPEDVPGEEEQDQSVGVN
jgi:hypothetical protein